MQHHCTEVEAKLSETAISKPRRIKLKVYAWLETTQTCTCMDIKITWVSLPFEKQDSYSREVMFPIQASLGKGALVPRVIIQLISTMELNSSVVASEAHSHSRKFVFACQAVGGKVTLWSWNSSLVSAASPHVVSLSAAHINILWRSS